VDVALISLRGLKEISDLVGMLSEAFRVAEAPATDKYDSTVVDHLQKFRIVQRKLRFPIIESDGPNESQVATQSGQRAHSEITRAIQQSSEKGAAGNP